MKTIAQQLQVKDFPFKIKDKNGKEIYCEHPDGTWRKCERDSNGNEIRYENSDGVWSKREYDSNGKEIYYEDSNGYILDNRPKQVDLTLQQIAKKMGIKVEQLRIKD